ncbi:acyl CoA:acetate/3-ketoacid CoA transferase [Nocardioides terrisoli]|uniref:acyl CoA:acetate/3-ketoacid CoA transferase n=1 Tax=Nocardioides terrisoli TaxID=3388267 RepID=UPI00287BC2E5|nr:CoA-transferase [Nocardioides marmorisolisilvae]
MASSGALTGGAGRFATPDEAAAVFEDGMVVAVTGSGGGILEADAVFAAIERRFLTTGHPRDLTVVHGLGIGDGQATGLNRFAHVGLVKCVIGGHWSWSPAMQDLAMRGCIEAYSLPAGVIAALLRESGARRPGLFTKVGLGTFVDPRREGGRLNAESRQDLVTLVQVDGEEYLHYKPLHVDIGIVRGSSADAFGNVSAAEEASILDSRAVALAARGAGGLVIAQVKHRAELGEQDPRLVSIPAPMVDVVVVSPTQWQTYAAEHDPAFNTPAPPGWPASTIAPPTDGARAIVALRAAMEVVDGDVVNVGFGMSAGVVDVLSRQGRLHDIQLVIEQGAVGGSPESGDLFGLSRHPSALMDSLTQFDFFATGMIDVAILGMGETDRAGNVNVSKLGPATVGPGGFIDIVHSASRLVFCGTFTARGLSVATEGGTLRILREGSVHKFVDHVSQVTFDAAGSPARNQTALYITERAVFELGPDGLTLREVAPGIDIERDILRHMDFVPRMDGVRTMPAAIFEGDHQPV